MKRVWSLHEVLPMIDLQNESSTDFKKMLRRCFISSQYMQQSEVIFSVKYLYLNIFSRLQISYILTSYCTCHFFFFFKEVGYYNTEVLWTPVFLQLTFLKSTKKCCFFFCFFSFLTLDR